MNRTDDLKLVFADFLSQLNVDGQITMDGVQTERLMSRDEISIDKIDLLLPDGYEDVFNVLIGATAVGHDYMMIDFTIADSYIGRGFVMDYELKAYQKSGADWVYDGGGIHGRTDE